MNYMTRKAQKANSESRDAEFMRAAISEAKLAAESGEVPVGCVITREEGGKEIIISRAHNVRETVKRASAHAEHDAIEDAEKALGGWRLNGCTLYVTLEPCPMCAGLISSSRISRVVYGAKDPAAGAYGSVMNMINYPIFRPKVTGGVLAEECGELMRGFFTEMRMKKKR